MGYKVSGQIVSFKAGGNLNTTTSDFRPVYINSGTSVRIANTTTVATNTIGIIVKRPKSGTGTAVPVQMDGVAMVYMNDTITAAGDIVILGTGGAIRGTALTFTSNQTVLGRALEVSAATGTIVPVALAIQRLAIATTTILD